jgi:hypothetical protein
MSAKLTYPGIEPENLSRSFQHIFGPYINHAFTLYILTKLNMFTYTSGNIIIPFVEVVGGAE